MADKPKPPKTPFGEDVVDRVKKQIIHGDVGYGRPPKEHQFKKGERSPYPRGRPRKAAPDLSLAEQPLLRAMHAALKKTIKAREGEKIIEMPTEEALAQAGVNFALKGNARFFGIVMDTGRQADEAKAREILRLNEFWEGYQAVAYCLTEEAKQKGDPIPDFLPHPDDIVLDHQEYPHFIGPFDENELKRYHEAQRLRDVLLIQDVLDQRSSVRLDGTPLKEPGGALLIALFLEIRLPLRFRHGRDGVRAMQRRFDRLTKRELLKSLYREWRKLGCNVARGFVFCDLSSARKHLEFLADFVGHASSGALDVEAIAQGGFNAAARSFFGQHGIPIGGF